MNNRVLWYILQVDIFSMLKIDILQIDKADYRQLVTGQVARGCPRSSRVSYPRQRKFASAHGIIIQASLSLFALGVTLRSRVYLLAMSVYRSAIRLVRLSLKPSSRPKARQRPQLCAMVGVVDG